MNDKYDDSGGTQVNTLSSANTESNNSKSYRHRPQKQRYQYDDGAVYHDGYAQYNQGYYGYPHQAYQQAGYVDEYGQFVPMQAGAAEYYAYNPQHGYYDNYRGGRGRGRGRGRGGPRGSGNRNYDTRAKSTHHTDTSQDHHEYNSHEARESEQSPTNKESANGGASGTRPKQFSYQRNRYRETRQNRSATNLLENENATANGAEIREQTNGDRDVTNTAGEGNRRDTGRGKVAMKSYSNNRSRNIRDLRQVKPQEPDGVETMKTERGEDCKDIEDKTFSEKLNPNTEEGTRDKKAQVKSSRYSAKQRSDRSENNPRKTYTNYNRHERDTYENGNSDARYSRNRGGRQYDENADPRYEGANRNDRYDRRYNDNQYYDQQHTQQRSRQEEFSSDSSSNRYNDERKSKHPKGRYGNGYPQEEDGLTEKERRILARKQAEQNPRSVGEYQDDTKAKADFRDEANSKSERASSNKHRFKFSSKKKHSKKEAQDLETQRGALIEQLSNGSYECMICCDVIRREVAVWGCVNCFHVFHLRCVKKWARSPAAAIEGERGWRCPACQNISAQVPNQYRCFCGRVKDPENNRQDIPHSCGENCGKKRGEHCTHRCNILCHPGPCPDCEAMVTRTCHCGQSTLSLKCAQARDVTCENTCSRVLNCGRHECQHVCHAGTCQPCEQTVQQECFCGKEKRTVTCGTTESFTTTFSCQATCDRLLSCGNHRCEAACHPGSCDPCRLLPEQVRYCACLKTPLDELPLPVKSLPKEDAKKLENTDENAVMDEVVEDKDEKEAKNIQVKENASKDISEKLNTSQNVNEEEIATSGSETNDGESSSQTEVFHRTSCLDPIPTCDKVCDKEMICGPQDAPHRCTRQCHVGACGPCALESVVHCRCGVVSKTVPCAEIDKYMDENGFICDKRCNKKKDCGRHKCMNNCCVDEEHKCDLVCNKKLSCGLHRCEEPCHRGNCPRCWQVSFDELACFCGAEVIMPPVPCGTNPPECRNKCTRHHPCGHTPSHPCHTRDECPPCPVLVERWCMGRHELRRNIKCHLTDVSCGMKCNKPLPCGHKCQQICHRGECTEEDKECKLPCTRIREECGHPCAAPCHVAKPCPASLCKTQVTLTCDCGNKSEKAQCQIEQRNSQDYQRMAASMLAMNQMGAASIDITELTKARTRTRKLECTSDCAIKERNKRLAEALDISNPDLSNKPGMLYTDSLKEYSKKNPAFVASVERALSDLVNLAQKGTKPRSHSFTSMKSDQRKFVHELAEMYGCTTQSYDEEPQRNVVATAVRDKCRRPTSTLTAFAQRELHPKAPTPIPHGSSEEQIRSKVQASNHSTAVLGPWGPPSTPNPHSATKKPSFSSSGMTTLSKKSSSSGSSWATGGQNNSPADSPRGAAGSSSSMTSSSRGWATTSGGVASSNASTPWGSTAATATKNKKKSEPMIDYFDMTD